MLALLPLIVRRFPSPALTVQAGLAALASLVSGTLLGYARYAAVIFPAIVAMVGLWRRRWVAIVAGAMMTLAQLVLFIGFCQFYPVL